MIGIKIQGVRVGAMVILIPFYFVFKVVKLLIHIRIHLSSPPPNMSGNFQLENEY